MDLEYKAVNLKGEVLKGVTEAQDTTELAMLLRKKGYYLMKASSTRLKIISFFYRKPSRKELYIFCKQFSVLFASGISIFEVLNILYQQSNNKLIKKALFSILEEIQKGMELSNTMEKHSSIFPPFMINMICIGEQCGKLEAVLKNLSEYYERENIVLSKLKSAMTYPIIVFVITLAITSILIIKVVPMYVNILVSMGAQLPFITRVLISASSIFKALLPFIILIDLVVFFMYKKYIKTERLKYIFDSFKLKLPIFNGLYHKTLCARFSRCMAILLGSGIAINKAVEHTAAALNNAFVEEKLIKAIKAVEGGGSISQALKQTNFFPTILISMISVGEETGEIDEMLNRSAEIFDSDVIEGIERATTLIEPIMILTLSVIVGFIILSLILPMYSVMDSMG